MTFSHSALSIFLINKTAAEPVSIMTIDGIANVENSGASGVCEGKGEVEAGVGVKVGFDVGTGVGEWVGFAVGADVGVGGVDVGVVVDGGSVGVAVGVGVGAMDDRIEDLENKLGIKPEENDVNETA